MTIRTTKEEAEKKEDIQDQEEPMATTSSAAEVEVPTTYFEEYVPPFFPVLILAFPVMPFFYKYHVRIDDENNVLSFGYNTWLTSSKKYDISKDIESVEVIDYINGLKEFGGWGIKMKLFTCATGYIAKNGPGIKLTTSNKRNVYYFNCDNPQQVCDIINNRMNNNGHNNKSNRNNDDGRLKQYDDVDNDLTKPLL